MKKQRRYDYFCMFYNPESNPRNREKSGNPDVNFIFVVSRRVPVAWAAAVKTVVVNLDPEPPR